MDLEDTVKEIGNTHELHLKVNPKGKGRKRKRKLKTNC